MNRVRAALMVALGGLCACEGSPGEARVQVLDPATAEPLWQQTVPSQSFTVEPDAPDGVLRVTTSDYCWESNFIMDFDRQTGELRSQRRSEPRAGTGGGLGPLEPPTACASGFAAARLTLSGGALVDVCGYTSDNQLAVCSVADGRELFRVSPGGPAPWLVAGERLVVGGLTPARFEAYALPDGEPLWSWTAPEDYTSLSGADSERLYLLSESSRESYAIALADGTVVWQKNLGCESLSLADGLLVCQQSLRDSTCDYD